MTLTIAQTILRWVSTALHAIRLVQRLASSFYELLLTLVLLYHLLVTPRSRHRYPVANLT